MKRVQEDTETAGQCIYCLAKCTDANGYVETGVYANGAYQLRQERGMPLTWITWVCHDCLHRRSGVDG